MLNSASAQAALAGAPRVVPRSEHPISRKQLSPNALKVLYRLIHAGFEAFLVGGSVRDALLGYVPKDFDVATNAKPEEIRQLFRGARLIGRRFRLAHVRMGGEIIEVSTFRSQRSTEDADSGDDVVVHSAAGLILDDNVYGSIDEDARRRDFTVNALYYTPKDFALYDFLGGLDDIEARLLRVIGDPWLRYREDPVRMLRAVRLAAKLNLTIEPDSLAPMDELAPLLREVPPARLSDELNKMFLSGHGLATWELLQQTRLFAVLFPETDDLLHEQDDGFITTALANTDERVLSDRPVTIGFLFAVLLWPCLQSRMQQLREGPVPDPIETMRDLIADQTGTTLVPARQALFAREVWELQSRFEQPQPRRVRAVLDHPRFRAAYDFMMLRQGCGQVTNDVSRFWTEIQTANAEEFDRLIAGLQGSAKPRRRRRTRT